MDYSLVAALIMGVSSSLHCIAMCGGISGALSLSLPEDVRNNRWSLFTYVLSYNAGRIGSYILAGAVIGTLGQTIFYTISPKYGHTILRILAALVMIGVGLYIAGWFSRYAFVEKIGSPLWRKIEPVGRRFIPARTRLHAFLFGAVWGWLPCGLVYTALIMTASSGGAADGAIFMFVFGIGTLPAVMAAGIITGWVARLSRAPYVKQLAGGIIIAIGVASLLYTGEGSMGELHTEGK